MNYRVFGGTLQSKCYIADSEQDRNGKGQREGAADDHCYHHASRDDNCRIYHFFTCQEAVS